MLKGSFSNGDLLKMLIFIFIVTAGITAFEVFNHLYAEYSAASEAKKELILSEYKGKDGWVLIFKLAVLASPILFLLKPVKSMKFLVALVAASYVLMPYHQKIIDYVTK